MNLQLQEGAASIVRWALALGAGYLVKAGIWTEGDASSYVAAAALAIVALGWSLYQKHTKNEEVDEALAAPSGTTRAGLRARLD